MHVKENKNIKLHLRMHTLACARTYAHRTHTHTRTQYVKIHIRYFTMEFMLCCKPCSCERVEKKTETAKETKTKDFIFLLRGNCVEKEIEHLQFFFAFLFFCYTYWLYFIKSIYIRIDKKKSSDRGFLDGCSEWPKKMLVIFSCLANILLLSISFVVSCSAFQIAYVENFFCLSLSIWKYVLCTYSIFFSSSRFVGAKKAHFWFYIPFVVCACCLVAIFWVIRSYREYILSSLVVNFVWQCEIYGRDYEIRWIH